MSNQTDTENGQENLESDGYTTIHAPIKKHEGYNLSISDFAFSAMNMISGFDGMVKRATELEFQNVILENERRSLEAKLAEAEALIRDIGDNHFVYDYQIFIKDLLCENDMLATFQCIRKLAYSYRLSEGHQPLWGDDSYKVEIKSLKFEELPGIHRMNKG